MNKMAFLCMMTLLSASVYAWPAGTLMGDLFGNTTASNSTNATTAINTTINVTTTINYPNQNTTITDLGTATDLYHSNGQYTYSIVLSQSNATGPGIYSFALLGSYGNNQVFIPSVQNNCTITSQISCRALFIVNAGKYTDIEVIKNGNWSFAIPLPIKVASSSPNPSSGMPTVQNTKTDYFGIFVTVVEVVLIIMVAGNVAYLKMNEHKLYNRGVRP